MSGSRQATPAMSPMRLNIVRGILLTPVSRITGQNGEERPVPTTAFIERLRQVHRLKLKLI